MVAAVTFLTKNFKDWNMYAPEGWENYEEEFGMGYLNYDEDGITPFTLFSKDCVVEEKC